MAVGAEIESATDRSKESRVHSGEVLCKDLELVILAYWGMPYRENKRLMICTAHFLTFHQGQALHSSTVVGWLKGGSPAEASGSFLLTTDFNTWNQGEICVLRSLRDANVGK